MVVLPDFLREIEDPRWLTWELRGGKGGRPTKVPDCSTLDSAAWRRLEELDGVPTSVTAGIGLVMTGGVKVSDAWLVALDMDGCRDPATGAMSPWAEELLTRFDHSYAEVTPSGTGLRLWLLVRNLPRAAPRIRVPANAPPGVDKTPEVQVFGCGPAGYVCVADAQVQGTGTGPTTFDDLNQLFKMFHVEDPVGSEVELPVGEGEPPSLADISLRLQMVPKGPELVRGEWEVLGYPSASECFAALVGHALRAARNHGAEVVDFLLDETAFGVGLVDSRDADKYARRGWVTKDVARCAGKFGAASAEDVFDDVELLSTVPLRTSRDTQDAWVVPAYEAAAGRRGARFLVHGVLPARGLAQLFGDPSSGKTPYAVHLSLCVALGLPAWFGHDVDRRGPVVYMAGEDLSGVLDRMEAQLERIDPSVQLVDIPVYVTTRPGRLANAQDAARWVEKIQAATGRPCVLLVVDTQAKNFGPGNENSTEDMGAFIDNVEALSRVLKCLVLLVHHSGHREKGRSRGASALPAALDAQFEVRRSGFDVAALPTKAKNWREPNPLAGRLVSVPIGVDEKDRLVTAITLNDAPPDAGAVFAEVEVLGVVRAAANAGERPLGRAKLAIIAGLSEKATRTQIQRAVELCLLKVIPSSGRRGATYVVTPEGREAIKGDENDAEEERLFR